MATILQVPNEILYNILSSGGLVAKDKIHLALTCRDLHQVASLSLYHHNIKNEGSSILIRAARDGRIDWVRNALALGADPNAVGPGQGETREQLEVSYKRCPPQPGADHDDDDDDDDDHDDDASDDEHEIAIHGLEYGSPLHYAAQRGHDEMVSLLLDAGALLDAPSYRVCECIENWALDTTFCRYPSRRWFPLHHAICGGHSSTAKLLVDRGAPLQMSYETRSQLRQTEIDDYGYRIQGPSLIHCAAAHGLASLVQHALDVDVDMATHLTYPAPPFHYTSQSWNAEATIECLVSAGVDLEAEDAEGRTALFWTCMLGNFKTAMQLLKAGAKPILPQPQPALSSWIPPLLHLAILFDPDSVQTAHWPQPGPQSRRREKVDFIRSLVQDHHLDVNAIAPRFTHVGYASDFGYATPLACAMKRHGKLIPDVIQILLENGADPNHASFSDKRYGAVWWLGIALEYALIDLVSRYAPNGRKVFEKSGILYNDLTSRDLGRVIFLLVKHGARFDVLPRQLLEKVWGAARTVGPSSSLHAIFQGLVPYLPTTTATDTDACRTRTL